MMLVKTNALQLSDAERIAEIDKRVVTMERMFLQWAQRAKAGYRFFNSATIIFGAAVPVIVLLAPLLGSDGHAPWVPAVAGILGALATLSKSIDSLYKNHETWLRNNDAYAKLKSEHFLFYERAGPYKTLQAEDPIATYAERVEAVIGSETTQWSGAEKAPLGDQR
ncbi:MAG: DUF4231 domain-containing protein [Candidatus Baltobacteraceae bacterium]